MKKTFVNILRSEAIQFNNETMGSHYKLNFQLCIYRSKIKYRNEKYEFYATYFLHCSKFVARIYGAGGSLFPFLYKGRE